MAAAPPVVHHGVDMAPNAEADVGSKRVVAVKLQHQKGQILKLGQSRKSWHFIKEIFKYLESTKSNY